MAGDQHRPRAKLNPDPIRAPPVNSSKLSGCGPHHSYRHLHHQRGTIGTFHVRLLEGSGLCRKHWSALSLGPIKNLGLSAAHGEVSSFGSIRLAFWNGGGEYDIVDESLGEGSSANVGNLKSEESDGNPRPPSYASSSSTVTVASSETSFTSGSSATGAYATPFQTNNEQQQSAAFMPSMPISPLPQQQQQKSRYDSIDATGKSPLTPLFDQGCIRSFSPARSPFFPSHAQQQQQNNQQQPKQSTPVRSGLSKDWDKKPSASALAPPRHPSESKKAAAPTLPMVPMKPTQSSSAFGPPQPHHYAREQFKSSTVHNDSNPIWGDAHSFLDNNDSSHSNENRSQFRIPLQKDDFLPTLQMDGGKVGLEIRLDEEMAPTESLLVGGALSTAVGAATAATSVVPLVGGALSNNTQNVSNFGMEMLGLSSDRLIGRGYVDLMPLLLGLWEESWELNDNDNSQHGKGGNVAGDEGDSVLNELGKINPTARRTRRRVERMGMLDVWVPLYHPSASTKASAGGNKENESNKMETSGKVHLLISYEPHGMSPKRDDVVAFESYARRPLQTNRDSSSANMGPILTPIVPPLSPLLVIEMRGPYLLLEYATSRTVTSVDRSGNVKSSRWERTHRVRIHRNAIFVIERQTLMDAAGNIARLPGDIVLSTPIGQEIAEVSAPIVAGAMELMGPAMLYGKLIMAAGSTGVRAGLAGAGMATEAIIRGAQEKALERRGEQSRGDAGVYSSYGG